MPEHRNIGEPALSRSPPSDLRVVLAVLAAVAVIALFLAGLYWMVMRLKAAADLQDCALSGRRNCGQTFPQY